MKKIINGVRYDTGKAQKIGSYQYSYPSDFSYVLETLYVTKSGIFLLHGEGGPQTQYAKNVTQNTWCGGEKLQVYSREDALLWIEQNEDNANIDDEMVSKYFDIQEG